jgi:Flp pilus assembly protein TadG
MFPVLLGFMGLSLDIGYIYHVKRRMQTAADAGALGGSKELWRGNTTLVTGEAKNDSSLNGFTDGANGITVTVNNPPASGPYAGNANFVEVIVAQDVPTYFMRVINQDSATVRARAVAGLVYAAQNCVLALDPTAKGALTVQGTSTLTTGCSVQVNSNSTNALVANGGGCLYATPGVVGVTGNWVANGSSNCVDPPPVVDVPPALDPLAYMVPPAIPTLPINVIMPISGGTVTLQPGLYPGGIKITGGTITFAPGTYILDGGGFAVSGNATLTGNGVTFYNTNVLGIPGLWGRFSIAGTVTENLSAPTSGPYAGVLFWDDKNAPNTPPGNVIAGTSGSSLTGAMYFPSTAVTYTGTSATSSWQMIIADTIKVSGTSSVTGYNVGNPVPPPTRIASLVE